MRLVVRLEQSGRPRAELPPQFPVGQRTLKNQRNEILAPRLVVSVHERREVPVEASRAAVPEAGDAHRYREIR